MIREAKRSEVEEEIRRQVDMLMREELDLLKIVRNIIRSILLPIYIIFCFAVCIQIKHLNLYLCFSGS